MMALAEREVIGVVRRSDLDRAGAEVEADPLVNNDGDLASDKWQPQFFAMQMQVALVGG